MNARRQRGCPPRRFSRDTDAAHDVIAASAVIFDWSQKPKPDFWVIDLTFEVIGWPEILHVPTNRCVS